MGRGTPCQPCRPQGEAEEALAKGIRGGLGGTGVPGGDGAAVPACGDVTVGGGRFGGRRLRVH